MDNPTSTHSVAEKIDRYRRELMQLYQQKLSTAPADTAPQTAPPTEPPAPEIDTVPESDTASELQAPSPESDAIPRTDIPTFPYTDEDLNDEPPFPQEPLDPPAIEESPYVGYLRVFAFTGGGGEPIEGARVTVSRQEGSNQALYANSITDRDGLTPVIPLPSVNPALTLQPDIPAPFVLYDIYTTAVGFRPALHEGVPVYGNNYVTQPVSLVPLIPGGENDAQKFQSGGPADL